MPDSGPSHFYFSPRCLFCNKNNSRRNTKKGRFWKCRHCGEMNPGPSMIKAMVGRLTTPPAGTARHAKATTADAPNATNGTTPPVTTTSIATSKSKTTKVAAATAPAADEEIAAKKVPTPRKPASKAAATPATPPPPAEKKRGIGAVIWG